MKYLLEMELPGTQPLDLKLIIEICRYLGSLIEPIYKSSGSSALILNDIGEMCVTKNGMKILAEIHCHHPLAKVIINGLKNHYHTTGDGSKTFLLLLKEIMINLRSDNRSQYGGIECRLKCTDEIFSLLALLPEMFSLVKSLPVTNELLLNYGENPEYHFKQITLSFFSTKFPFVVAEQLSDLVCQFVSNEVTNSNEISQMLQLLSNNFPILASKIESTMQPAVIDGFVFSRRLNPDFLFDSKEIRFVVLENTFESVAVNKAVLKVDNATKIHQLLHFHHELYLNIVKILKASNISLVLMSGLAAEEFKSVCRRNDIFIVDGILQEELDFLLWYANMMPFDSWESDIHVRHIGYAKHAEIISLGSGRYLQLLFAMFPKRMPLRHMVISATIKGLCDECYNECWNCIKVLSHFVAPDSLIISRNDQEPSKINKIYMACPFPAWCNRLCDVLNSSVRVNTCTFNLRLISAIKHIMQSKFNFSTDNKPVLYLEPVTCYERLICNVLHLSVQLLKIDKIINVKKNMLSQK